MESENCNDRLNVFLEWTTRCAYKIMWKNLFKNCHLKIGQYKNKME